MALSSANYYSKNLFGQSNRGVKPMNQSLQQQPALIGLIRLQSDDEDALADGVLP